VLVLVLVLLGVLLLLPHHGVAAQVDIQSNI
jgi:hypothetical protein